MLASRKSLKRGDTLVEVLFATATFSLVAVGGMAVMNQGASIAQRSLEISLVRNEIDSQAETLRFLNASYVKSYQPAKTYSEATPEGQWSIISSKASNIAAGDYSNFAVCPDVTNLRSNSFILDTHNAKMLDFSSGALSKALTYSKVEYSQDVVAAGGAQGVWIEAVKSASLPSSSTDFIDFYIRSCWYSGGQSRPSTISTIVRLYEPK